MSLFSLQLIRKTVHSFLEIGVRESNLPIIFITGTDTGCGKTLVTSALLAAAGDMGLSCAGIKAVQTGCSRGGDALLAPDVEFFKCMAPKAVTAVLQAFEFAASPHLAAEFEGAFVDLALLVKAVKEHAAECVLTVVEGAGGVLTPLNNRETIADLIFQIGASAILVVPNKLGAINQALLSIEAMQGRGIPVLGFILTNLAAGPQDDAATKILNDNPLAISRIADVPCLAEIPYLPGLNTAPSRPGRVEQAEAAVKIITFSVLKELFNIRGNAR